jgi:hypothetical protein
MTAHNETKAGHTPGPWSVKRGEGRYSDQLYVESNIHSTPTVISGKDQIVQLTSFRDDHGREVEANARLIAASPSLFDYVARKASEGDPEAVKLVEAVTAARATSEAV